MSNKVVLGAGAIGAFLVAQSMVASVFADGMLTIVVGSVGFGMGYLVAKR